MEISTSTPDPSNTRRHTASGDESPEFTPICLRGAQAYHEHDSLILSHNFSDRSFVLDDQDFESRTASEIGLLV